MRWLIWYFRSLICKHEWRLEEQNFQTWRKPDVTEHILAPEIRRYGERDVTLISATCKKCGWHRSYSKFDT